MLNSVITESITLQSFLICIFSSLALGVLTAHVFTAHGHHTDSLTLSLAMLPPVVTLIIMLVNGNIGAGLAVAGTFALVRFRSVPGSAKEITGLFFSVALGLACGMGYVAIAGLFFVIISLFLLLLEPLLQGQQRFAALRHILLDIVKGCTDIIEIWRYMRAALTIMRAITAAVRLARIILCRSSPRHAAQIRFELRQLVQLILQGIRLL